RLELVLLVVDRRPGVAVLEPIGHGEEVILAGVGHVLQLAPRHRRRDRRARDRAEGVRRGDGAVAVVLVVVHEDALAPLLLPPRRGDPAVALLELAPEAD